jgi:dihydrofolate reductase
VDGASAVRQALIAGVIDELTLDIVPVLLGSGERIFEGAESFGFEPVEVLHSPLSTHIGYRRVQLTPQHRRLRCASARSFTRPR